MEKFNIQEYLAANVSHIIKDATFATLKNPKETLFLAKFARSAKRATKIRESYLKEGTNIPAFLIASITYDCNLECAGCYSRANNKPHHTQLTAEEWEDIFAQARDLGISFIVLAGGEPMLREDVIAKAADFPEILFPIFTNGTMASDSYLKLFDKNRNLVPILSIEGNKRITDSRRGDGIYDKITETMQIMKDNGLIFGSSVTVTKENLDYVTSDEFIAGLKDFAARCFFS